MSTFAPSIATLITTVLVKKLGLDTLLYGPLFNIIESIVTEGGNLKNGLKNIGHIIDNLHLDIKWVYLLLILIILVVLFSTRNKIYKKIGNNYQVLHISGKHLKDFHKYFYYNKNYLLKCDEYNLETPEMQMNIEKSVVRHVKPVYDKLLYFHDKEYNISGSFKWECRNMENKTNDHYTVRYLIEEVELRINKNTKMSILDYFLNILRNCNKIKKINCQKALKYIKYFDAASELDTYQYEFYNEFFDGGYNKNDYIDSFFHEDREYILSLINDVATKEGEDKQERKGQVAKIGFLIHGPNGTGKSNFAFRLAKYLKRHIVTINLTRFTKKRIYKILSDPGAGIGEDYDPNSVIFLFDEFNYTVLELMKKEKEKEVQKQLITDFIVKKDKNEENKKVSNSQESSDSDYMTVTDLLELFQGAIPFKGAIFIATTNNYEQIKNICPDLVRYGRLTPIFFDNFNGKLIKEAFKFYFKKDLELKLEDNEKPNITNSMILEWMQKFSEKPNGHQLFYEKYTKYLKER